MKSDVSFSFANRKQHIISDYFSYLSNTNEWIKRKIKQPERTEQRDLSQGSVLVSILFDISRLKVQQIMYKLMIQPLRYGNEELNGKTYIQNIVIIQSTYSLSWTESQRIKNIVKILKKKKSVYEIVVSSKNRSIIENMMLIYFQTYSKTLILLTLFIRLTLMSIIV